MPVSAAGREETAADADDRSRLLRVIARGVPPDERCGPAFRPLPEQDAARHARWAAAWWARFGLAPSADGRTIAPTEVPGVRPGRFVDGLVDVEVADEAALPDWALALLEWWQAAFDAPLAEERDGGGGDAPGTFGPLDPLMHGARRLVDARIAGSGASVAPSGRDGLLAILAGRAWRLTDQLLDGERRLSASSAGFLRGLGMATSVGPSADAAGWLERLERSPVLAHLLGVTLLQWRTHVGEILDRLAADGPVLATLTADGSAPGALIGVRGDTGDIHNAGRAVAILELEGGLRVVYKPKDLRVATGLYRLVRALDDAGLEPPLPTPAVIDRGGYAWEAYLPHLGCEDARAIERFFQRMGMWIRLFQLLEGRDLWLDNLVASGEEPVFIDLETLLQPRRRPLGLLASEVLAQDRLEESPGLTCIPTMLTPIEPGIAAVDLGALAAPRTYLSPFPRPGGPSSDASAAPEERFMTWTHPEHAPLLGNVPATASDHLEAVVDGYRRMHATLLAVRDRLASPDGPLEPLRDGPVRFIVRDTWSCLKLVRRSTAPAMLADPIARELFLAQLHTSVTLGALSPSTEPLHRAVIEAEIAGLRRLDVPLFQSRPGSDGVWCPDGSVVPGYLEGTAWERLMRRVAALPEVDLEEQVDLLRSSFSGGHSPPPDEAVAPAASARRSVRPMPEGECLAAEAVALAEAILGEASVGPDGDRSWLGLAHHPHLDLHLLEVLRPDLLSGACGPAILFAELARWTGEPRWWDAALGALTGTLRTLEEVDTIWADLRTPGAPPRSVPPFAGGFYGVGAHVYTVRRVAGLLDRPDLAARTTTYLAALPLDAIAPLASVDPVSGLSGLALALTAPSASPDPAIQAVVGRTLAHLGARRGPDGSWPAPRYPVGVHGLDALPGTDAALALVHARLGSASGDGGGPGPAGATESQATPGDVAAWRSLGDAGVAGEPSGAGSGIGDPLDALEVALAAWGHDHDAQHSETARVAAAALLDRRVVRGAWIAGTFAADRHQLSIVRGLPAIALALLRVAALDAPYPGRVMPASVRLLA